MGTEAFQAECRGFETRLPLQFLASTSAATLSLFGARYAEAAASCYSAQPCSFGPRRLRIDGAMPFHLDPAARSRLVPG